MKRPKTKKYRTEITKEEIKNKRKDVQWKKWP